MAFVDILTKKNTRDIAIIDALLDENEILNYYNTVYTYDGSNNLTSIVWKDSTNTTIRTDTFAYSSTISNETIVQTTAIVGGATTVISTLFDLNGNIISVDRSVT